MASNIVAGISPLNWTKESTEEDYDDFFWSFESHLIANHIDHSDEKKSELSGSKQAVAMLIC